MQKAPASNKLNLWCHLLHSNYICRHMFMPAQGDDRYWKVWKWYLSIMTWQRYVQDILFSRNRGIQNCGFIQEKVHVLVFLIRSNIWIMEQIRARNKEGKTKSPNKKLLNTRFAITNTWFIRKPPHPIKWQADLCMYSWIRWFFENCINCIQWFFLLWYTKNFA